MKGYPPKKSDLKFRVFVTNANPGLLNLSLDYNSPWLAVISLGA